MKSKAQKEINQASKVLGNLTDKQYEQYVSEGHKKQNKERASKGGLKTLKGKGYTTIQKKGNKIYSEIKTKKYKSILSLILKKEFTYSDVRNACEKFGVKSDGSIRVTAKRILKEKTLVKQIHKGCNQHNPSLYVKVK